MIQNNSLSSQIKFNQNQIKNTVDKKIHYQMALVGQSGQPKNNKLFLTYSMLFFAQCYPPKQILPKSDEKRTNLDFQNF